MVMVNEVNEGRSADFGTDLSLPGPARGVVRWVRVSAE